MNTRRRTVTLGLAAFTVAAALAAIAAPASADPPPAAAGTSSHGFIAENGVLRTIDHPGATTVPATPDGQAGTATTGINDRGQILGAYEDSDRIIRHFVRDKKGRYTELEEPADGKDGTASDEYVDINNRGEIVGFHNDKRGATTTGFLRTKKGRFVDIDVPGSQVTGPLKINDKGQVVGLYIDAKPNPDGTLPPPSLHGLLWADGDYETIDVPVAAATGVLGINNRGQMVGFYIDDDGAYHGFVRDRRGDVTTLPEAPRAEPTMGGTQPSQINDRGQIVGLAYDAEGGVARFSLRPRQIHHVQVDAQRDLHSGPRHKQPRTDSGRLRHAAVHRLAGTAAELRGLCPSGSAVFDQANSIHHPSAPNVSSSWSTCRW